MKLLNSCLNKYGVLFFAITTLLIALFRVPFWDEAHAFDIACLKVSEIFYMTRIEGHFMLWYLLLKLFSNLNFYPYSMLILNWFFCTMAVCVLFKYAPFSPVVKFMISFSAPFLFYFAPVSRCYAIGIFVLFVICAIYPNRFKKPYLFSFLILILSNTSIMALIGGFYIGILYFFELIEKFKKGILEKKKLINVFLIFLFCGILIFIQLFGLRHLRIRDGFVFTEGFLGNCFKYIVIFSLIYFSFYLIKNFKKNIVKKAFFFLASIYLTLSFIFVFFYHGNYWNHYFYYVYFIAFFWIFKKILYKNKIVKFLFYLILIFMLSPLTLDEEGKFAFIYSSRSNLIADYISKNPILKDADLYTFEWWGDISPCTHAYLAKDNIKIYDTNGLDKRSFKSLSTLFLVEHKPLDIDEFVALMNKNKNNYILTSNLLEGLKMKNVFIIQNKEDFIFKTKEKTYSLKLIDDKKRAIGLLIYQINEI